MNLKKYLFSSICVICLILSAAQAAEVRNVKFRAIAFDVWSDLPALSYRDADGRMDELRLSKLSFSAVCETQVEGGLNFFDSKRPATANAIADSGPVSVASATLSPNSDEFILVFVPVEVDGRRIYRIHPIASNDSAFSRGGVMFVNLSNFEMVAKMGDEKMKLPAGMPSLVEYQGDANRFNGQIQVAVYLEENWRMFYSSQWIVPKTSKTVVMIYKNIKTGYPLLRSVSYQI